MILEPDRLIKWLIKWNFQRRFILLILPSGTLSMLTVGRFSHLVGAFEKSWHLCATKCFAHTIFVKYMNCTLRYFNNEGIRQAPEQWADIVKFILLSFFDLGPTRPESKITFKNVLSSPIWPSIWHPWQPLIFFKINCTYQCQMMVHSYTFIDWWCETLNVFSKL